MEFELEQVSHLPQWPPLPTKHKSNILKRLGPVQSLQTEPEKEKTPESIKPFTFDPNINPKNINHVAPAFGLLNLNENDKIMHQKKKKLIQKMDLAFYDGSLSSDDYIVEYINDTNTTTNKKSRSRSRSCVIL